MSELEKQKALHRLICVCNAQAAVKETRDGREVYVVPFKTMKGNQPLNGINYPPEEIANSVWSFEGALAPVGHPMDDEGNFIYARSNDGLARGYVGAHCEDCQWVENSTPDGEGRIHGNFIIDIAVASRSDDGQWLLRQVKRGNQIPTSTGLLINIEMIDGVPTARDIYVDHNAFLRGEKPAASTTSGTGAMVNKEGKIEDIRVHVAHTAEDGSPDTSGEPAQNKEANSPAFLTGLSEWLKSQTGNSAEGAKPMADKTETEGVSNAAETEAINSRMAKLEEQVGNAATKQDVADAIKPLVDAMNAEKEAKANAEADERKELSDKLVASNSLTAEEAADTPISVLRKMAGNAETEAPAKKAAAVNTGGESGDVKMAKVNSLRDRLNKKESK